MKGYVISLIGIAMFSVAAFAEELVVVKSKDATSKNIPMQFTLEKNTWDGDNIKIWGTVRNTSKESYECIKVIFTALGVKEEFIGRKACGTEPGEIGPEQVGYIEGDYVECEGRRPSQIEYAVIGVDPAAKKDHENKVGDVYINSIGMKLAWIPPGKFIMGSPENEERREGDEGPQHFVGIRKGFWLGQTEVTIGQYLEYLNSGGDTSGVDLSDNDSPVKKSGDKYVLSGTRHSSDLNQPMGEVSWEGAVMFCEWLSVREGRPYSLPTEAEWEYACRAGTRTPFYFGRTISTDQANYNGNYTYGGGSKGVYRGKTMPVGSFPPNAFGLYDMHGNVWEWCDDWYASDYYSKSPRVDPPGPFYGEGRVLRGGAFAFRPYIPRSADRHNASPIDGRNAIYGFRVAAPTD